MTTYEIFKTQGRGFFEPKTILDIERIIANYDYLFGNEISPVENEVLN